MTCPLQALSTARHTSMWNTNILTDDNVGAEVPEDPSRYLHLKFELDGGCFLQLICVVAAHRKDINTH